MRYLYLIGHILLAVFITLICLIFFVLGFYSDSLDSKINKDDKQ